MAKGVGLLIIMLVIDIMLFANGYIELPKTEEMWDVELNKTSGEIIYNESNLYGVTTDTTGIFGSFLQNVYNTLGYIWNWVLFAFGFVFAPLSTMIQIGAPFIIKATVGLGWSILGIVSIVSIIRGFEY